DWKTIDKKGRKVEGAYYKSGKENNDLIIFIPGMPGDGVVWFEEKHLSMLLKEGFDVFVARHGGILTNEEGKRVLNNSTRNDLGLATGNGEMHITDWMDEPKILMEYFAGKQVTFITHSLGSVALAHSLIDINQRENHDLHAHYARPKKWINLSGPTYTYDTYKEKYQDSWKWYFDNKLDKICNVEDKDAELAALEQALKEVSGNLDKIDLFNALQTISVIPEEDEYVGSEGSLNLQNQMGAGLILKDRTIKKADLPDDREVHDFEHMTDETLKRFVLMKMNQNKHTFTLKNNPNA